MRNALMFGLALFVALFISVVSIVDVSANHALQIASPTASLSGAHNTVVPGSFTVNNVGSSGVTNIIFNSTDFTGAANA